MICLIAAVSKNNQIGLHNQMPWHIPEDLAYFREITSGHTVIMGRKTFESIGKPLPHRTNMVLTTNPNFSAEGVFVLHSLNEALELCKTTTEAVFVIGGGEIYKAFLPFAEYLYITLIDEVVEGDTCFPDYQKDFQLIKSTCSKSQTPTGHYFFFTLWKRIGH